MGIGDSMQIMTLCAISCLQGAEDAEEKPHNSNQKGNEPSMKKIVDQLYNKVKH